jgi:hypothetical protein
VDDGEWNVGERGTITKRGGKALTLIGSERVFVTLLLLTYNALVV